MGKGKGSKNVGENGGLRARHEGTPATKTPVFSFLLPPATAKF